MSSHHLSGSHETTTCYLLNTLIVPRTVYLLVVYLVKSDMLTSQIKNLCHLALRGFPPESDDGRVLPFLPVSFNVWISGKGIKTPLLAQVRW